MAETTHSSKVHGGLERVPGKQNWIERLPAHIRALWHASWIYRAAKHLHYDKGMTIGHAIATAKNASDKGCATGDLNWSGIQSVNPKSRTEMCSASALWRRMKAMSGGKRDVDMSNDLGEAMTIDLAYISAKVRSKSVKKGTAVKDKKAPGGGSYPINNAQDVKDAVRLFKIHRGKYSPEKQRRIKSAIKRNAKKLGKTANLSNIELAVEGHAFNPLAHHRVGGRFVNKGAGQANKGMPTSASFASAVRRLQLGQTIDLPGGKGVVKRLKDGYQVRTGDGKYNKIFKNVTDAVSVAGKIVRTRMAVAK